MRGRYAPTPSGPLHIGNVGTALLAWLQVRSAGGTFILRMEDLDAPRSKKEYADQILADLKWLGIDWDEGPEVGGPFAPYGQSARYDKYSKAFDQLQEDGWLYPCFCSRKDLRQIASAPHGRQSEGAVYPGICRHLSAEERKEKAKAKPPAYRFAVPDTELTFVDGVMGRQTFPAGFGGDFVVKRADAIFSYQLAVVVDDALMKITDVLRGADLLDSTPRQIFLYEALGYPIPRFAHVPLFYGPDGHRLSKRHGERVTIPALRDEGVKPEVIVGVLAYLYRLIDQPEPVKASELVQTFDLASITKQPVVLDDQMLKLFKLG